MVGVLAQQIGWVAISGNTLEFNKDKAEDDFTIYRKINDDLKVSHRVNIDFVKLQYRYQLYKTETDEVMQVILDKSDYIMREVVAQLEFFLQDFIGAKYVITCAMGTDALFLPMNPYLDGAEIAYMSQKVMEIAG